MNLREAKAYYLKYNGHGYFMFREEPDKYRQYESLQVDPKTRRAWDEEIMEKLLKKLWERPSYVWAIHGEILEVLKRKNCDITYWMKRFLEEMAKMAALDKKNKILIIENMAGRNAKQTDGGVCLISTCTDLAEQMCDVMDDLVDFECDESDDLDQPGWQNVKGRYDWAVNGYRNAVRKFGISPQAVSAPEGKQAGKTMG